MCGITGYINLSNKTIKHSNTILEMLHLQKHRGPDDSGICAFNLNLGTSAELSVSESVGINGDFEGILGFNRLSILDLSQNGHQPMRSPDGNILLTLNGEIYNAFDYKKELQDLGYKFKSTSDTEIVLALYLNYGVEGMLKRLNGMFAIVIVDLREKRILIIRDRFGIKPMYYIINEEVFAFSSELKSFRTLDKFAFQLDEDQLDEYLLFRNNLNGTLFKNVRSLTPGHYLLYTHTDGLAERQFFNINDYDRSANASESFQICTNNVEKWLWKSVDRQLMSDVKLGCQLSGGINSSLVTWLANKNVDKGNFEAVSIIFKNPRYSEEKYINTVTEKIGITSHKFLLDSDYYLDHIEKASWHLEAPLNHPNTVAIYKLSQRAKDYVTVLLSGEGADEVFGGYDRFYELSHPYTIRLLLHQIKKCRRDPYDLVKYFDYKHRAIMATSFMTSAIAKGLLNGFSMDKAIKSRKSLYNSLSGSLFDRQVKYEMLSYLPDLLIRQDKMSMAHSIENRVPYLDNEIVEKSFSIPENYLIMNSRHNRGNGCKLILKKVYADVFGNDLAFREKMGFGVPVKDFFSNVKFVEYLNDKILPAIRMRGLFNYQLVTSWISNIDFLGHDETEALWLVVAFEIWASLYLN